MNPDPELNWLDKLLLAMAKGWGIYPETIHIYRIFLGVALAINTSLLIGMVIRPDWPSHIIRQLPPYGWGIGFGVLAVVHVVLVYLFTHPAKILGAQDIAGWERAGYFAFFVFLTVGLYICIFSLSLWLYGPPDMWN